MQFVQNVEAVMSAFFDLLSSKKADIGAQTITRTWVPWEDLNKISQPAIVIVEPWEQTEAQISRQPKITLTTQLVCYLQTDRADLVDPPPKRVNDFIFNIRSALLPSGSDIVKNTCTLGGLAAGVFVNGKIVKDSGVLDDQASILIPVTIILP